MGYYTRILSTNAGCVHVSALQAALSDGGLGGKIEVEAGDPSDWTELVLRDADGVEIAAIERNPVTRGSLGGEELEEFHAELAGAEPQSSAQWLKQFFPKVKNIYAFQHLGGARNETGFEMLSSVRNTLWASAPAIFQADDEGFSNEAGYHILWQFPDSVRGAWWMGLLRDGEWIHLQMNLGNKKPARCVSQGADSERCSIC
jgi:hypothetical protein